MPRNLHDHLVERIAARFEAARIGDPHDPRTEVGPLISQRQRERVENYVSLACEAGARVVVGGSRGGQPTGWYVEPTLLMDVDNSMRVAREEIFGPVLCVLAYDCEDDAVAIANDSEYGLSGAVYSADPGRALRIARLLRTGAVDINGVPPGMAAPRGGFKKSGIGREVGPESIDPYTEIRAINLDDPSRAYLRGQGAQLHGNGRDSAAT